MSGEPMNAPSELRPHVEALDELGQPIGKHPKHLTIRELEALGHTKTPLLRIIRKNCIDCAGGSQAEARRCSRVACEFWPYRMGSNPFFGSSGSGDGEEPA